MSGSGRSLERSHSNQTGLLAGKGRALALRVAPSLNMRKPLAVDQGFPRLHRGMCSACPVEERPPGSAVGGVPLYITVFGSAQAALEPADACFFEAASGQWANAVAVRVGPVHNLGRVRLRRESILDVFAQQGRGLAGRQRPNLTVLVLPPLLIAGGTLAAKPPSR